MAAPSKKHLCPICGAPSVPDWKPFCSQRCSDVDLGKWVSGVYAIPGEPADIPDNGGEDGETPR
ncbi:MAG: DNA gyrase inhibitor YacG [Maricaulaceae bacterium]|nr:DNA gyrase inhibitor YacG [Maricaulaceae bacterium]